MGKPYPDPALPRPCAGADHASHGHGLAGHDHASHGHGHAGHGHGVPGSGRRLAVALAILSAFTLLEGIGGYLANSIALLAEAAHMLTDSASLLLAIIAIRVGRRPADAQRTFGHRRYQPLAAFVNGQLLLLLTAWVVYEAVMRLLHPPRVDGPLMLAIALAGGVANFAAFLVLGGTSTLNERAARMHVLSDLLGSVVASIAALVIILRGWSLADPLLSLLVSALILRSAWSITRDSAEVLLESVPAGFEVRRVEQELVGQVPGVLGVHHVHAWSITGERPTVTLHANIDATAPARDVIVAINRRLRLRLDVEHVTVQVEEPGDCHAPDCGPQSQRG
ncbi:MAG: cation transporter [Proteobacteria bacterium]|nr:cation transporter [Pseudomonadota bacterium]